MISAEVHHLVSVASFRTTIASCGRRATTIGNWSRSQLDADGSAVSTRLTPRTAGFGAASAAVNRSPDGGVNTGNYNRTIQARIRFQF
jgi:hypothetical protein